MIKYGSVCSGVEAATVAWHSLGWKPQFFSEIEAFPSAVLRHHYPDVPNYGDMTKFKEWNNDSIDLLVGGTPCQSFSVAGLRKGLDDPRGNLMLTYLAIAERFNPSWLVWENVPGVLSSNRGRDFGTFLGALGKLGYGFAYRVLDAQHFGVAQRRKRVFVVGHLGDWRGAAAVLFERESMSRNIAESRKKKQETAGFTASSFGNYNPGVGTIRAAGGDLGGGSETLHVAGTIAANSFVGGISGKADGAAANHIVAARMKGFGDYECDGTASTIKARDHKDATDLIAFPSEMSGTQRASAEDVSRALAAKHTTAVAGSGMRVRRLTPKETERLQGFPDDYTRIPWRKKDAESCPDGPRYKAMGNSMAVPAMRWIGERIQKYKELGID